jgi:hypothetical protein
MKIAGVSESANESFLDPIQNRGLRYSRYSSIEAGLF